MATDVQGFLAKKVGPLPMGGWIAGAAGLVGFLYLRRKGAPAAQSQGQQQPFATSPIIVTPGTMPDSTSSVNPPGPAAQPRQVMVRGPGAVAAWDPYHAGVPIRLQPGGLIVGEAPWNSLLTVVGDPVSGPSNFGLQGTTPAGAPASPTAAEGSTLWWPIQYAGTRGYVSAFDVSGGLGGGASTLSYVPGSGGGKLARFSGRHAHQQYLVTGMGGGGHGSLQQVSQRTGVPIGRLMALNPHQWQKGRRRGNVIHIA